MRKLLVFVSLYLALLGGVLSAQFEVSADDMRDIEDTAKSLDSNVSLRKTKDALSQTRELTAYFQKVETFYAEKGDAEDGARFARRSHEAAAQATKALESGNFEAAANALTALTRTCKVCHDTYKKD